MILAVSTIDRNPVLFLTGKADRTGVIEPHGETQTVEQVEKYKSKITMGTIRLVKLLNNRIRITNLRHKERYKADLISIHGKGICTISTAGIINDCEGRNRLWLSTQSANNLCKDPHMTRQSQELWDSLREPKMVPNNCPEKKTKTGTSSFYDVVGNGVIVVRNPFFNRKRKVGRMTAQIVSRKLSSKAGPMTKRGSENNITLTQRTHTINANIKSIANIKNLVAAYELIKSNPGNMTPGIDSVTLDGIDLKYFQRIQEKLRAGTYKFPPARRTQIPKEGKTETRPLTIASPRDKIVQKAIQIILERVYEPKFLETSHGFRPNKGTHTALQYVDAKFQSVHYIIEADISKAFDKIPHSKMMDILKRNIHCTKTLALILSGLKAGFMEGDKLSEILNIGTPQGSVLSPLLCNIFFHEFDIFMETLKSKYQKGLKRPKNKEYMKLQNKAKYMRRMGYNKTQKKEYEAVIKSLLKTPSQSQDDSYIRIHYVRYADDFIIGVEGSYTTTLTILQEVKTFLNTLDIQLNETKTRITKFTVDPMEFLGYKIMGPNLKGIEKPIENIKEPNTGKTVTRRKKIRIRIYMNDEKVVNRLYTKKFIRKRIKPHTNNTLIWRGTFRGNLINLEHADIIRYYNSVIRGIYNYYRIVGNMNQLAHVIWLLTESCALTLARKYGLRTLRKTFNKFGKDLGTNIPNAKGDLRRISIFNPQDYKKQDITSLTPNKKPLKPIEMIWNSKFTKSNLFKSCIICGSTDQVQMHHVRSIRDLKNPEKGPKDFFTKQMAAINRKQVPLCKEHHARLHSNTLSESEYSLFNKNVKRK